LTITGATSTTARFDTLPANLVFVTSGTFPGNLGSALAYQAQCNSLATAAGINNATNDAYIAWMAASDYDPVPLLGSTRGWVRADLLPWIDDMAATISSGDVFYPAAYDENGQRVYAQTWSGMDTAGHVTANCGDWRRSDTAATASHTHAGGRGWLFDSMAQFCSTPLRVRCVMKGRNTPVAVTPVAGKKIYVTKSGWSPAGGISAADAKCLADAPGSMPAAKAVLVASTRTLTDVLSPTAGYVRPDGVRVGTGAEIVQALTTNDVPATIESVATQDGDGNFVSSGTFIWSGLSSPGSAQDDTCHDWTLASSSGSARTVFGGWQQAGQTGSYSCDMSAYGGGLFFFLQCAEQ
jgi:hypothetical protein